MPPRPNILRPLGEDVVGPRGATEGFLDYMRLINAAAQPEQSGIRIIDLPNGLQAIQEMQTFEDPDGNLVERWTTVDYVDPADIGARGGGGGGRTLFPEESRLMQEQALSERFGRAMDQATFQETQRQNAHERVSDRLRLLQATDQLLDERRRGAISAMIEAAPFFVGPEQRFMPGLEPGGVGQTLGGLLGADVQPFEIPRHELPLQQMVDAPLAAGPQQIDEQLAALLNAPQIPVPGLP